MHAPRLSLSVILPCLTGALALTTLTACPEQDCDGPCTPSPTERRDMGMFMRPDLSIIGNPRDKDMEPDEGMIDPADADPDLTSGSLLDQSIITSEFGSDHNFPQLHMRSTSVEQVTIVRDFSQPARFVQLIRANMDTWGIEEAFLDTLMNQATQLLGHDQLEPPSAIYQSAANQDIYLATLNADGQWEASPVTGAIAGSTEVSLQALARRGDTHAVAMLRPAGNTNELVVFIQTGPTSWSEPVIIAPQSDTWTIESADVALDANGTAHIVYAEARPDQNFTGGKDSRVAYRSSLQSESTDIFKGGAYEHRPTILVTQAGRVQVFYRSSEDLRALPLNTGSYSLDARTLEPGGSQWSDPRSLRNDMMYYNAIEGPDGGSVLVGSDPSGDLFLRLYRNRTWGNLQTIKADYLAIPTSDTNHHLDASFDSSGNAHIVYRTRDTELAYVVYRP